MAATTWLLGVSVSYKKKRREVAWGQSSKYHSHSRFTRNSEPRIAYTCMRGTLVSTVNLYVSIYRYVYTYTHINYYMYISVHVYIVNIHKTWRVLVLEPLHEAFGLHRLRNVACFHLLWKSHSTPGSYGTIWNLWKVVAKSHHMSEVYGKSGSNRSCSTWNRSHFYGP